MWKAGASIASCRFIPWYDVVEEAAAATTGPAGRRPACPRPAARRRRAAASDGDSVVRGRRPGASELGSPSSSQNICARVPRQKPSPGIAGELCSQPPLGVAETRLPWRSATSTWQVSPVRSAGAATSARRRPPRPCAASRSRAAARAAAGRARRRARAQLVRGAARRRPARGARPRRRRRAARRAARRRAVAVPGLAVGEARASRTRARCGRSRRRGAIAAEVEALEQRELLQQHRPLAPRPGLADRPAVVVAASTGASTVARAAREVVARQQRRGGAGRWSRAPPPLQGSRRSPRRRSPRSHASRAASICASRVAAGRLRLVARAAGRSPPATGLRISAPPSRRAGSHSSAEVGHSVANSSLDAGDRVRDPLAAPGSRRSA